MNVTIKEVAKLAGVSPSTVSRVISDSPRISDETKRIVRDAMSELGYHPNAIARSLVSKATNTIGIVMPQSTERAFLNPFFPQALSGVSAAAHEQGYCILLSTGNTEKEQLDSLQSIVTGGRVDGVIIMYSPVDNSPMEILKKFGTPSVVIGKPLKSKDVLYVDNDNVEASFKVTEKLISNGHKKIAFISGSFRFVVSLDRLDGYMNALKRHDIPFRKEYILELSEFITQGAYEKTKQLLTLSERPTALVVTDDVMAFGAMDAIKECGLRIPEDIEIMSFNNVPSSELTNPSLTSVDIDAFTLGYEASKLIIEKIKGEANREKVIVPTKIVYRETSRL
ncbi:LacI family transcriptional regulator [Clostridium swellfunianum]|uniref:LacI family DNA-binding transcriptional regulator n=1 Tax=Clostridium swellfunianum TaxID=1367462 RepID=UPI00202F533A|nr:LacI family DNA-binding transcriptional regulator [Clostridium swellfunianum]MCM0647865.1 LacI family transcriptional regulator [Clostridium swellfunianum]